MQFQQQQSLFFRLQLIDERLESIASADSSEKVSGLIQTFLDEINARVASTRFSWRLKTNNMFSGFRYTFTVCETWYQHTANSFNINFDSNDLTFISCYPDSATNKKEELVIKRKGLEERDKEVCEKLESFLYSCRIHSDLFKSYDEGYIRKS